MLNTSGTARHQWNCSTPAEHWEWQGDPGIRPIPRWGPSNDRSQVGHVPLARPGDWSRGRQARDGNLPRLLLTCHLWWYSVIHWSESTLYQGGDEKRKQST